MNSSSKHTYLFIKSETAWTKPVDIKDYPDQGNDPEQLETTTLADEAHTYIEGLEANSSKEFTANYDLDQYKALEALKGKEVDICLSFGKTGEYGQFVCKGYVRVGFIGKGVNEVREMKITITPTTQFGLTEEKISVTE